MATLEDLATEYFRYPSHGQLMRVLAAAHARGLREGLGRAADQRLERVNALKGERDKARPGTDERHFISMRIYESYAAADAIRSLIGSPPAGPSEQTPREAAEAEAWDLRERFIEAISEWIAALSKERRLGPITPKLAFLLSADWVPSLAEPATPPTPVGPTEAPPPADPQGER